MALVVLAVGGGVALLSPSASAQDSVAPATAWLSLDETTALERIALGSPLDQAKAQPIWKAVLQQRPQLFIMMGDNVYGDGPSAPLRELRQAYAVQARQPEQAEVRASIPFLRIWDDHDYGLNDGGASFAHKAKAAERVPRVLAIPPPRSAGRALPQPNLWAVRAARADRHAGHALVPLTLEAEDGGFPHPGDSSPTTMRPRPCSARRNGPGSSRS